MVAGLVGEVLIVNITFRTDASLQIGTGHVMRCLTLAHALRNKGADCRFVCREHPGNMIDYLRRQGFDVVSLPVPDSDQPSGKTDAPQLAHATWLGCDWATDAVQTKVGAGEMPVDWLIVDHYALDARWEQALRPIYRKLLVIDDLADRAHVCDVLLDQNMVENINARYQGKVPEPCTCLLGPEYALLRPEFNALRSASLTRRETPELNRLLVFLGGCDEENETSKVVEGIKQANRKWQHIDVVVGQGFPAIQALKKELAGFPSATLHVQTSDMARLMAAADMAITAGGSVTWEKCALGLPSLVAIQGDNQHPIATKMHEFGAQITLGLASELTPAAYAHYLDTVRLDELTAMTQSAAAICDGSGIASVLNIIGIQA